MNNLYNNFTNLYPVSKTLRFELIPQGKTLERMKEKNIIESEEHRNESYKKAKNMIDTFHKKFIDDCLINFSFDKNLLSKYYELSNKKDRNQDEFEEVKFKLREEISKCFTQNPEYKKIFGKEIITEILPTFYSEKEDLAVLDEFSKFTTYFNGFSENRKNMYVSDEKSTSIAYRMINENLPIFISNINMFTKLKKVFDDETFKEIYNNLEEILQVNKLDEMFELDYFNDVLTQKGIDIYNQVIGGYSKSDGVKIKGINEYINEFKQNNPKNNTIFKLDMLYKQILSERDTASFVIEKTEDDQSLLNEIKDLSIKLNKKVFEKKHSLKELLINISNYDLGKIYIRNDLSITEISQFLYSDWSVIFGGIKNAYDCKFGAPVNAKQEENKKKYLKSQRFISLDYINNCTKGVDGFVEVEKYFSENCVLKENGEKVDIFDNITNKYNEINELINNRYPLEKNLKEDRQNIALIKEYLDALKQLQLLVKKLITVRYEADYEKDGKFYESLSEFWDEMNEITHVYNKARNYLTGKTYSTNKIKLNFNNPTLLNGWDVNKEQDNKCVILRKNGLFYLAIMDKDFKGVLETNDEETGNCYEKMNYKLLPGANKMLPKVFFADKNADIFKPSYELLMKYGEGRHKKGANFDLRFCHELIDYFKECINKHPDWKNFKFKFSETNSYKDISEFYKEVEQQGYKITYSKISEDDINELVEDGNLYLFQIYNKDFSKYSHGKPNLHTLYWKMLFSENNLKDVVYKLNGEAEIFYRRASIQKNITHPKNEKINNKNRNNPNKQSIFEYDLIKDKRFTEDKFLFHVPITLNFKSIGISNINEEVNKAIKNSNENYIIGIDRGERHLLYLVLINKNGEIVEQYSLNSIINENQNVRYETNYHELLDYKEKEREKARESWQSIENIKNLKEGYLSQVINKITDLMIKYNAIVVLEDLNFGFMRGRQKFEKQVYQKFEKMLIDKLNYLAKKDIDENKQGGLLKAYQLTNKFDSFKKLGKQSGVLYYIPAWNTSKMDPATGFVNLFYLRYENVEKSKDFVRKIDDIRYNDQKGYFEFDIDYKKFTAKADGTRTKWTLCSYGSRIYSYRNRDKNSQWDSKEVDITNEFKTLFEKNNINFKCKKDIKDEILKIEEKVFWEDFIRLFKLMVQIRNSEIKSEKDYIISPIMDENGLFFDSRLNKEKMPKNADANGAYNIARKGLWIIEQIKNTPDDKLKKVKLAISNKDWLNFAQKEKYED